MTTCPVCEQTARETICPVHGSSYCGSTPRFKTRCGAWLLTFDLPPHDCPDIAKYED